MHELVPLPLFNHPKAAVLTESEFAKMFPELVYLKDDGQITSSTLSKIRETLCASKIYREYLLEEARRQREFVIHYLKQEINFAQKFAFVEFWGRGYTQTCLARLLWEADGKERCLSFIDYRLIVCSVYQFMVFFQADIYLAR